MVIVLAGLWSCSDERPVKKAKVQLVKTGENFMLYRNGSPFEIRGAAGFTHLAELKAAGANTIRIWDTVGLTKVLSEAHTHGIAVIVGLPVPESRHMDFYADKKKTAAQFEQIRQLVNRHKSAPALLMWCLGNELVFPYRPRYNPFYAAFNGIVDMIHRDDPDHPVTTTMINFQWQEVMKIKLRTDIDLISYNIFKDIKIFRKELDFFSWFYTDPYLFTEWGIDGPWDEAHHTAWMAYIEPNSTLKAQAYRERFKRYMPVDDPRFLGSFLFYWGQKQEVTSTWFSLFDESGNKTESVSAARYIWTGKEEAGHYPKIKVLQLNGREASENIILAANTRVRAKLTLDAPVNHNLNFNWAIYREDWFRKENKNNEKPLIPLNIQFGRPGNLEVEFLSPVKAGPYRIFVKADDGEGRIATANIPFYIAAAHEKN